MQRSLRLSGTNRGRYVVSIPECRRRSRGTRARLASSRCLLTSERDEILSSIGADLVAVTVGVVIVDLAADLLVAAVFAESAITTCLLYTSPSPRDA
eukprot:6725138-Heterocapsa_arctica.AAC.1